MYSDCPAGGVGVEVWPVKESDPFSFPSLTSVTLVGNGGDGSEEGGCGKGGGILVTPTAATATSPAAATGGVAVSGASAAQTAGRVEGHAPAAVPVLALSGCTIRDNAARLGGGIAIGGPAASSWSPSAAARVPAILDTAEMPPSVLDGVPTGRQRERGEITTGPGGAVAAGRASSRRTTLITGSQAAPGGRDPGGPAAENVSEEGEVVMPGAVTDGATVASENRVPGGPAAEGSSEEGGVVMIGVVIDGATVVLENRATSGGGLWASGAAVSAVGGRVVLRGNVAGGLGESCGEEVR